MATLQLRADDPGAVAHAAEILRAGGTVAFPTETVYGLGANALSPDAVHRVFTAKERPAWDPVIVHIADLSALQDLAREMPVQVQALAERFWPGPLTLLLPRSGRVPDVVTAGRDRVAVRMPAHPVAQQLIRLAGVPVAAPSANRFGRPSPTTAQHVLQDLNGRIDAVVDGGASNLGVESTVLDPASEPPLILRPGGISREQLEAVLGRVDVYQPPVSEIPPESLPSPGVGIRHYAPNARLVLVDTYPALLDELKNALAGGKRVGVMLPSDWASAQDERFFAAATVFDWGDWGEWDILASRLFAGLRWLDAEGVNIVICPMPEGKGIGLALRDRLGKASR